MAKKFIALILTLMLVVSLAVIPGAAAGTDTSTVNVGVISYLIDELGSTGWQVHYWGGATAGDADMTATGATEQKAVSSAYWSNEEKTFTMFTAQIPADATGIKIHNGERWFGDDGLAGQKAYVFNYSGDKALYAEDVQPVEPEVPTEAPSEAPTEAPTEDTSVIHEYVYTLTVDASTQLTSLQFELSYDDGYEFVSAEYPCFTKVDLGDEVFYDGAELHDAADPEEPLYGEVKGNYSNGDPKPGKPGLILDGTKALIDLKLAGPADLTVVPEMTIVKLATIADGEFVFPAYSWTATFDGETVDEGGISNDPVITQQPVDWSGAIGDIATFTVAAEGDGLTYQWFYRAAGATKWSASSTTDATYTIEMTAKRADRELYCLITDAAGNSVASDIVTMTIDELAGPVITSQPVDWSGAVGDTVTFTVAAQGNELTYKWFYRAIGSTKWAATSATAATYSIVMTEKRADRELYCKITDADGNTVDTDIVTMTIAEPAGPVITSQPVDWSGAIGETVTFTVAAEGNGLTYQWYYRAAGKTKWTAASDTDATYSIVMTEKRADRELYCQITDAEGVSVDTDIVTMTIDELAGPVITSQPVDWSGAIGDTVTFTVAAEGDGLTYKWFYRAIGSTKWTATSATDATYSIVMTEKRADRELYCQITDADGSTVDTDIVTMTIAEPAGPVITTQPVDWSGAIGETVTFTVAAEGNGLTYQWYYRAAGKTKWTAASDTDAVYSITMTSARAGRELYCKITDADGNTADTNIVTMTIG